MNAKLTTLAVALFFVTIPAAASQDVQATGYEAPEPDSKLKDRIIDWCKEHPDSVRCDRLKDVAEYCRDHPDDVRCDIAKCRAAHAIAKRYAWRINHAIDGLEHRVVVLEFAEKRVRDAQGNDSGVVYTASIAGRSVDVNGTFAPDDDLEGKLERIQAAQDKLLEKIQDLYEKRAQLRERFTDFKQDKCAFDGPVPATVSAAPSAAAPGAAAPSGADGGDVEQTDAGEAGAETSELDESGADAGDASSSEADPASGSQDSADDAAGADAGDPTG